MVFILKAKCEKDLAAISKWSAPIATQGHDHIGRIGGALAVQGCQCPQRLLCGGGGAGQKGDMGKGHGVFLVYAQALPLDFGNSTPVAARKPQIATATRGFLSETFFAIVPEPVVFLPSLPFFLRLDSRNPIQ